MSLWNFTDDKESTGFGVIPKGVYNASITEAKMKDTQKGDQRLNLTFTIQGGDYHGRKIFEGYNMSGSEKAVQIGRGQLKAILKAGGKGFEISGPEDFLGIELAISVKVIPEKDGYAEKNGVQGFKPAVESASGVVPF